MHLPQAASRPAQRSWQGDVIRAHAVGGRFQTGGLFGFNDHLFQFGQRTGEAGSEAIRQQAERAMPLGTIPARHPGPGRINAPVSPVTPERASPGGMERAVR